MKKVAILQSNYIPWKGYFDLINMVDEFILYDDTQYTKNDWRNRNLIKTDSGIKWITIPTKHEKLSQKINETKTINNHWRKKHWKTLNQYYSKSYFFNLYKEKFEKIYLHDDEIYLSKINYNFIRLINELLGINTEITNSNQYSYQGNKSEKLITILKQAKADIYITGPSAKQYIDLDIFKKQGIKITWMDYSGYKEYFQLYKPFEHYVSIVDLIFNMGPESKKYLKSFN